jgi:hypothetical protein
MREQVLLFCLLGLVLTATIMLVIAPGAVTLDAGLHRMSCPRPGPGFWGDFSLCRLRATV